MCFFPQKYPTFLVIVPISNHLPSSGWNLSEYIKDRVQWGDTEQGVLYQFPWTSGQRKSIVCICYSGRYGGGSRGGGIVWSRKGTGRGWITKNKRLTASATRCAGGRAACKCPLFSRGSARPATLACKGLGWRGWCGVVRWAVDRSGCPWEAAKAEDEGWAAKGEVAKVWVFSEGGAGPAAGAGNGNTVLTSEWAGTA